jgi:hypothetical protein
MKRLLIYLSLPVGLILIYMPLYAQTIFPGIDGGDTTTWLFRLAVGAVFAVTWYLIKRFISSQDTLTETVGVLATEVKLLRREHIRDALTITTDVNILKRRANRAEDWQNKHNIIHAKCPHCPDIPNDTKNDEAA